VKKRFIPRIQKEYKLLISNCEYMFTTKNQMTILFMILYYNGHIPQVMIPYFTKRCILCKVSFEPNSNNGDENRLSEFRVCDTCYSLMFKLTPNAIVDIKLIERFMISTITDDVYKLIESYMVY
jgi:hypothetical protein